MRMDISGITRLTGFFVLVAAAIPTSHAPSPDTGSLRPGLPSAQCTACGLKDIRHSKFFGPGVRSRMCAGYHWTAAVSQEHRFSSLIFAGLRGGVRRTEGFEPPTKREKPTSVTKKARDSEAGNGSKQRGAAGEKRKVLRGLEVSSPPLSSQRAGFAPHSRMGEDVNCRISGRLCALALHASALIRPAPSVQPRHSSCCPASGVQSVATEPDAEDSQQAGGRAPRGTARSATAGGWQPWRWAVQRLGPRAAGAAQGGSPHRRRNGPYLRAAALSL
jgi:hypothetical protein